MTEISKVFGGAIPPAIKFGFEVGKQTGKTLNSIFSNLNKHVDEQNVEVIKADDNSNEPNIKVEKSDIEIDTQQAITDLKNELDLQDLRLMLGFIKDGKMIDDAKKELGDNASKEEVLKHLFDKM